MRRGGVMVNNIDQTRMFDLSELNELNVETILTQVYNALEDKGYNPVNQLVGYLLSGDPAYISNHKDARSLIKKIDRDEIIEELVKSYLENLK
jgi:uncharacterized protein (UPF0297 family)